MWDFAGAGHCEHATFRSVKGHLKVIARSKFYKFKLKKLYKPSPSPTPPHTNNDTHFDILKLSCKPSGSYWIYSFFTFYFEIMKYFAWKGLMVVDVYTHSNNSNWSYEDSLCNMFHGHLTILLIYKYIIILYWFDLVRLENTQYIKLGTVSMETVSRE